MERKPWLAAGLFLCILFAGASTLAAGAVHRGPECAGMTLPQRSGGYAVHARMDSGRQVPRGHRGAPQPVEREPLLDRAQAAISAAEPAANAALDQQHWFIQLYGGIQTLSGRTFVDDPDPHYSVVKLSDGSLAFLNPTEQDVTSHGLAVARLRDVLEAQEIPLLYVQAPQKLQADDSRLPQGVSDYGNDYADQVLAILEDQEVPVLDLREVLAGQEEDWSHWFFRTDHHWTPEAAFTAYQALTQVLEEEYEFTVDDKYTDPDSYQVRRLSQFFLGSQGKRVGTLYGGVDDIEMWLPTFYTDFTYSIPSADLERTGPFHRSLLFTERVREADYFNGNPYTLYAGGDYSMARIYNHESSEGPRVLLLRDSFACAMTPFLALDCGELITMDLRYFNDRLLTYVNWLKPDMVIVMYAPGSCSTDALFDFFHTPGRGGLTQDAYLDQPPMADLTRPGQVTDLWTGHRKG